MCKKHFSKHEKEIIIFCEYFLNNCQVSSTIKELSKFYNIKITPKQLEKIIKKHLQLDKVKISKFKSSKDFLRELADKDLERLQMFEFLCIIFNKILRRLER